MATAVTPMDCIIFGGGVAGLFTLDACVRKGMRVVLLESKALGTGQTIDSQGIIHGGLKYAITGNGSRSASAIKDMPTVWRKCLAGESLPNLQHVVMRSDFCHVWRTDSIRSKLGWIAAKFALRTKPVILDPDELPHALQGIQGSVARLGEQVIEPRSLLEILSHNMTENILQTAEGGVEVSRLEDGWLIQLLNPETGEPQDIFTKKVVLTAGSGNAQLRTLFSLEAGKTQARPLHMVMARGDLPVLNGHCIDGAKTRVTITTTKDYADRWVWQIGGQLAEDGIHLVPEKLIQRAVNEIKEVLPNVDLSGAEFTTYTTTRAEQFTRGARPSDISILEENNVYTCWPTKLAFAPRLADEIIRRIGPKNDSEPVRIKEFSSWPTPVVALPPWEHDQPWTPIEVVQSQ